MNPAKFTIFLMVLVPYVKKGQFFQSRNQEGYLEFIDINSSILSLEDEYGITYKQSMDSIHALRIDGSIIKDIKVFQQAYGLFWVYAPTKLPIIDKVFEAIYRYG